MTGEDIQPMPPLGRRSFLALASAAVFITTQSSTASAGAPLGGLRKQKISAGDDTKNFERIKGLVQHSMDINCNCSTFCSQTSHDFLAAADLWLQVMKDKGVVVPDYVDTGYVVRILGLESVEGSVTHRKDSRYLGPFQYSLSDHTKIFWLDAVPQLVKYFNDDFVRTQVALTPAGANVTPASFQDEKTYLNPYVQTAALMFLALNRCPEIESSRLLSALPKEEKQSWLYLCHNLPSMAEIVRNHLDVIRPIRLLAPRNFARYYTPNAGIYGTKGAATPKEVLWRIKELTQMFFDRFHPEGNSLLKPFRPAPMTGAGSNGLGPI